MPLLLILVLAGIEFAGSLRAYHRVTALSRDIGLSAYRDCFDSTTPGNCLGDAVDLPWGLAQNVLPGVEVSLSLWRWDGSQCVLAGRAERPTGQPIATRISAPEDFVDTTQPSGRTTLGDLCHDHGGVLTSEVFFDYERLTSQAITGSLGFGDDFYMLTIF